MEDSYVPQVEQSLLTRGHTVRAIYDSIVTAIAEGSLPAGAPLHDQTIATALGISRTPVREALLRLKVLGVVETAPNRHTTVINATPTQVREALTVWTALFELVCEEVLPVAPGALVEYMRQQHQEFVQAFTAGDNRKVANANLFFYTAPTRLSQNAHLKRDSHGTALIMRLGGLDLPQRLDVELITRTQANLITAFTTRDLDKARAALRELRTLNIPTQ